MSTARLVAAVGLLAAGFACSEDPEFITASFAGPSAIVVAGAAGLAVGWTIIDPGDRTRTSALAEQGRRSAVIALGLMVAFVLAGLIEGFVTGSGLPTALRVGVGAAIFLAFWTYVLTLGRRAAAEGYTGAFG